MESEADSRNRGVTDAPLVGVGGLYPPASPRTDELHPPTSWPLRPPQVRIQLPLVDSCTQTDVACHPKTEFSPSVFLNPYVYRDIPLTAYYPTVSVESPHHPHTLDYSSIPWNSLDLSRPTCVQSKQDMAPVLNGSTACTNKSPSSHHLQKQMVNNSPTTASADAADGCVDSSVIFTAHAEGGGKKRKQRSAVSSYLAALRPWAFPGSITPVVLGACLAYKFQGMFNIWTLLTTILTALCVHAAGNLVNTYFDYMRGIDNKKSDDRTLVDSILTPNDVVRLGAVLYVSGCAGFALLALISPARMEHLALVYFCGLSSSFFYTGGLGLKYIAMGDILIVLTFGPLTVVFSHLSQTGQLSLIPMIYAIPLALNAEAILHANNARDADSDRQAGAVTLAILLGRGGSYSLFCFLLFSPFLIFITIGVHYCPWMLLPAAAIFPSFGLEKEFRRGELTHMPQRVARLNLLIGLLYTAALCMADASSLPSMTPLGS